MQPPTSFHILSFEGPDPYARAGGIASRITGLSEALAGWGFDTHLWFVGDPDLPGHEDLGRLHVHRWCQWISHYHRGGVYAGEEGKRSDYAASLPPYLMQRALVPLLLSEPDRRAVILAEEWHTVDAVLHLDWLLRSAGLRDRVSILWNANNVFGFDRIDWQRLRAAATITTVSRYMRQLMWNQCVDAVVIPNGLAATAFQAPDRQATVELRTRLRQRAVLSKVARWDPDKRWLLAVDTVAALKRHGRRPLLVARGGIEAHGADVLRRARGLGLVVAERRQRANGVADLVESLDALESVDVLSLQTPVSAAACRVLFRTSDAVLANSAHEPFGLVGLEAMAVGALACVGGTGEDYAVPGWNALILQTNEPTELVRHLARLDANPVEERALRRRAASAAKQFAWTEVVRRNLLPHVGLSSGEMAAVNLRGKHRRRSLHLVGCKNAENERRLLAARGRRLVA
jgi:glycosyltransferase involved in cell wall biosynthesis